MKKVVLILLLIVTYSSVIAQSNTSNLVIKIVSAKDVRAIIDSSKGPMIVNFWASWCGPCVRELPYFDSILATTKTPVKLLLVSLDFPESYPTKLTAFVKKKGYKGEVVFLGETNADLFIPVIEPKWTGAIPASIFLDNSKKYYQVLNQQIPVQRFTIELEKLLN